MGGFAISERSGVMCDADEAGQPSGGLLGVARVRKNADQIGLVAMAGKSPLCAVVELETLRGFAPRAVSRASAEA